MSQEQQTPHKRRVPVSYTHLGVFKNIQKYLLAHGIKNVSTEQAVLELYKGKLTTNLKEHSGEGIFFSSRMLTEFAILSDHAIFSMKSENRESFIRSHLIAYYTRLEKVGTMVVMLSLIHIFLCKYGIITWNRFLED